MSRFTDGLKIIPRTAWVIAAVCYVGVRDARVDRLHPRR